MDYFFNEHFEVTSNLTHFKNLITKLLEDRNYKHPGYLYHQEKYAYLFGIIQSEMFHEYEQTFNSLEELEKANEDYFGYFYFNFLGPV